MRRNIRNKKSITKKDIREVVDYLKKNYYSWDDIKNFVIDKYGIVHYEMNDGRILESLRKT